jgi:hypothetical protein
MARPRNRPPKPEVLAKEAEVVKLRRGGLTWDLIAKQVGYKHGSSAQDAYVRASQRIVRDDIEAIRKMEEDRLDMAQASIWSKVMQGEISAINTFLRIQERRAKLLGLDQPLKQQIEVTNYDGDTIDAEVRRLVELLDSSSQSEMDSSPSQS